MADREDSNARIWKSAEVVQNWVSTMNEREQKRAGQWKLMGLLLPFNHEDGFTFLDLGAGTGAAARAILDLYPNSSAILADYSQAMIEEGSRVLEAYVERYDYVEFDMLTDGWPSTIPVHLDAIVTSQCVHHLPDDRKQSLFREIFDRLEPGAWYLNFDPVTADDPAIEAAWDRANAREDPGHHDIVLTPEEQERHANHVRHMAPLARQLEYLRSAGFSAIDVYWKHLDYVIYGGSRPA